MPIVLTLSRTRTVSLALSGPAGATLNLVTSDQVLTLTLGAMLRGATGQSAYAAAVAGGFVGTEAEWLASLEGDPGLSAYAVAVENGFVGTEAEWLASLQTDAQALLDAHISDPTNAHAGSAITQDSTHRFTTDAEKAAWNAKQAALGFTPIDAATIGQANGVAPLDSGGKVAAGNLPSYVDDVIEVADYASLPGVGETGKIYVTLDANGEYRWSGSMYIQLVASPGSTDAVAEGSFNLYFAAARVLATLLTGLSTAAATTVTSAHTVLQAIGFLQKQNTDQDAAIALREVSANKDASGGYAGLTLFGINFKNALGTFTSLFQNANTATRIYTFQDRSGTIADDADLLTAKTYTDSAIAAIAGNQAGGTTGIVTGGNYAWTSGLSYLVSAATYLINGTSYASAETTITLDAADATYDRFDLLVLDTAGTVQKITGTAAAAPSEPSYDPTSQLKLTLVSVAANATTPAGAASETVYAEAGGGEWTDTTSGTGINSASTSGPRTGSVCIEATSAGTGAYVQLERATASSLSTLNTLGLYMKSKAQFSNGRALKIQFFLNGVAKGNSLVIAQQAISSFGFDTSNTSTWQFVSIPIAQFVLPAGATVNQIRITAVGAGTGWRIDDVTLSNSGTTIVSTSSGISEEAADARYEKLASKDVSAGYVGKTLEKINFYNTARTFMSFLVNAATAARTYTFPDKSGTVAMTSDITGTNSGTNTGDQDLSSYATTAAVAAGYLPQSYLDTDATLAADSDTKIPSQKAIRAYTATLTGLATLDYTVQYQLSGEGFVGSVRIADDSRFHWQVQGGPIASGGVGPPTLSATLVKVGSASIRFGGTQYLTIGGATDFAWMHKASAKFTWEGWVSFDSFAAERVLFSTGSGTSTSGLYCAINTSRQINLQIFRSVGGTTVINATSTAIIANSTAWQHIAVQWDQTLASNNLTVYVDGVLAFTASKSANANSTEVAAQFPMTVGGFSTTGSMLGYMDQVRLVSSILYSGTFTPRITAYPIP